MPVRYQFLKIEAVTRYWNVGDFFFKMNATIWCSNSQFFKSMESSILFMFYLCNFQFCNLPHSNILFAMKNLPQTFFFFFLTKAADYTVKLNGKISYKDNMIHVVNIHLVVCYLMTRVHSLVTERVFCIGFNGKALNSS